MKYLLTLIITYAIYSAGCTMCSSKKVTCAAFKDSLFFKWFPYREDQRITYKNQVTGDTIFYIINRVYQSEQSEILVGGWRSQVCSPQASISASDTDYVKGMMFINYYTSADGYGNGTGKSLSFSVYNSNWGAAGISENAIEPYNGDLSVSITLQNNVQFDNGVTYQNMVTFTKDTIQTKEAKLYKLYIAKNAGIVGFEMYPSKQKWILQ